MTKKNKNGIVLYSLFDLIQKKGLKLTHREKWYITDIINVWWENGITLSQINSSTQYILENLIVDSSEGKDYVNYLKQSKYSRAFIKDFDQFEEQRKDKWNEWERLIEQFGYSTKNEKEITNNGTKEINNSTMGTI